jgi:hypothetical protein
VRGDEVGLTGTAPGAPTQPTWAGVIAGGAMFLLGLFGCAATGLAAAVASESDAMAVSYLGVPFAIGGTIALIAAGITRSQQPAIAIGVPIGCGCVSIVVGVVGMIVFFTAIWPSL